MILGFVFTFLLLKKKKKVLAGGKNVLRVSMMSYRGTLHPFSPSGKAGVASFCA